MKNAIYICFIILIASCSSSWHLHRAVKLNPKYGDSTKITKVVLVHDTIRDTLLVPSHNFDFTIDSLRHSMDSFNMVYSDSFITIYGAIDSLGKIKMKGKIVERKVPFEVIVHDTIHVDVQCPPSIVVSDGYPKWYLWVLIAIFVVVIYLFKK